MDSLRKLFNTPIRIHLVRVGRLELPASCSQSKRATNCATPGYEVFQLWSNMGSTPVFDQFPARGKTPSALASQSFPGFWRCVARTPASRAQITCATNCATPGYSVFLHDTMLRRKKQVFRVCGRRCGQARFFGSFSTGEFPPQATVPMASKISPSGEWLCRLSSTECIICVVFLQCHLSADCEPVYSKTAKYMYYSTKGY